MEDESTSLDGKGLLNMRVVDLKLELEKRGLSKSGSKKDLVKRLKQQLEFEKLCEERKTGDFHVELELDAETQQNEFVQQYLAQQQKRFTERQEEKRLQLEAMQKCPEDSTVSSDHQSEVDENASSDVDDKEDEKQNLIKSSEIKSPSENIDDENASSDVDDKEDEKQNLIKSSEVKSPNENLGDEHASSVVDDKENEKQNLIKLSVIKSPSENIDDENASSDVDNKEDRKQNLIKPSAVQLQSANLDDENASSGVDDKGNEKQNLTKLSEIKSQSENVDDASTSSVKSVECDKKDSVKTECDSKLERFQEKNTSSHSVAPVCDTNMKNIQLDKKSEKEFVTLNSNSVVETEDTKLSMPKCLSETETKDSIIIEREKDCSFTIDDNDNAKKVKSIEVNISNQSFDEKDSKDTSETGDALIEHGKSQNKSSCTFKESHIASDSESSEKLSSTKYNQQAK